MYSGNPTVISYQKYQEIIQKSDQLRLIGSYEATKHQWEISDGETWLAKIFLPWNVQVDQSGNFQHKDDFHLALVMIRAGIAVTGYFHNDVMLDHKVFRAYMVRQKQGKSQIKYLKTKGKSRAGSRLRLGESERFFQEINERLQAYDVLYPISMWGISCGKTLFPYFMGSETPPPFSKKQDTLLNIPFHIQQPDFETLKQTHQKLNSFHLILSESGEKIFDNSDLNIQKNSPNEDEDW